MPDLMNWPKGDTPFTRDEVRQQFLQHVASVTKYWQTNPKSGSMEDRVAGAVFSVLVALDGNVVGLPGFSMYATTHKTDMHHHKQRGERWYEPHVPSPQDIAGDLHGSFHQVLRQIGAK